MRTESSQDEIIRVGPYKDVNRMELQYQKLEEVRKDPPIEVSEEITALPTT